MSRQEKPKHSGLGGVFKSFKNSLKPASGRVPVVVNAKVVGGGPDINRLLQQLQNGSISSRIAAANEISESLRSTSITSTSEIWYLARDMCDSRFQSAARRSALHLMIQCIRNDYESVANTLIYYRDISNFCVIEPGTLDPDYDLFLRALMALTGDGKSIHDLYMFNNEGSWSDFVLRSFEVLAEQLPLSRDLNTLLSTQKNLILLAGYLKHCFKFNSSILDQSFLHATLETIHTSLLAVSLPLILENLAQLLKTITAYTFIPAESSHLLVRLLCWIGSLGTELHVICWKALSHVFFESPFNTISIVVSTWQDPDLLAKRRDLDLETRLNLADPCLLVALGAISMLEEMFLCAGSDSLTSDFNFSYVAITSGLRECIRVRMPVLNSGLLRMFDRVFSSSSKISILFPFNVWYASSNSVFSLLSEFRVATPQEEGYWSAICTSIYSKFHTQEIVAPEDKLIALFLLHPRCVDEEIARYVISFYKDRGLCTSMNSLWKENCMTLLSAFYFSNQSKDIRVTVLETVKSGTEVSRAFEDDPDMGNEIALVVLKSMHQEEDPEMIEFLYHTYLFGLFQNSSLRFLRELLSFFEPSFQVKPKERFRSIVSLASFGSSVPMKLASVNPSESDRSAKISSLQQEKELAKCLGNSLVTLSVRAPERAKVIYDFMIEYLLQSLKNEGYQVLVTLCKCLIRMRCTVEGYLYFTEPQDMTGLATSFRRNTFDSNYVASDDHWWTYPDHVTLPKEYFDKPGRNMSILKMTTSKLLTCPPGSASVDVEKWVHLAISILEEFYHWELYSFVWAHFCAQLTNMTLFESLDLSILRIRKVVCDQLNLELPKLLVWPTVDMKSEVKSDKTEAKTDQIAKPDTITKADLQVAFIRTLSSIIGYHDLFSKQEEDQVVSSLLFALGSWEKTAIPVLHILTICCYEIPQSMQKYLIPILSRLQTGVTSAFASSPTLEFLMALIHVPSLTSSFTPEEFKRVFAISFRYIEHATDMKRRNQKSTETTASQGLDHGKDAEIDYNIFTQSTEITPVLRQYLFIASFELISRWFLKIKLSDRPQFSSFIIKNLILCCGAQNFRDFDELTISYLDFISRFTYSDFPLKITSLKKPSSSANVSSRKWLIGQSIVGIETDIYTGNSTVTLRRPTGLSVFNLLVDKSLLSGTAAKPIVTSSHMFLQLFRTLVQDSSDKPIALLEDPATDRALSSFDRIPLVAHLKAGIVYVGPNQKEEVEILANRVGSPDYQKFLEGIGKMVRLKDCEGIYVGGLDRENDTDGEFAYYWDDPMTQIIFHTTTLMPNISGDKYMSLKKRHIGNNYVNIFFDDSGLPFNFNVIRSQFNFLNIVITPHTKRADFADVGSRFYKIKAFRKGGVPGFLSTAHFKMTSLEQLPKLVRNLLLMTGRYASIWHESNDGAYTTNWAMRVRQIHMLRQKTLETHKVLKEEYLKNSEESNLLRTAHTTPSADTNSRSMVQSFLEQLQPTLSPYTPDHDVQSIRYESTEDNELHTLLEFNSYTY